MERLNLNKNMKVSWLSGGLASAVATYIALQDDKHIRCIYINIDDQHPDTMRFIKDLEGFFRIKIEILQSQYKSVDSVCRQFRMINMQGRAKCTDILKRRVRKEWELVNKPDTYIWGFDIGEKHRAERIKQNEPNYIHIFPCIEKNLAKNDCIAIVKSWGISIPEPYKQGILNNNCIGCIKGGMYYWNIIRKLYPEIFKQRAKLERDLGYSIIKGVYLDELKESAGRKQEILEECSVHCEGIISQSIK